MVACSNNRSYQALPVSIEQEGVVVSVFSPDRTDADFAYTVRNASADCIAMSAVRLPQGTELFLDGVLVLVDESGHQLSQRIGRHPADTMRRVIALQPGEAVTRIVNLRDMFGVSQLDGYTASLTITYCVCEPASSQVTQQTRSVQVPEIRFAPGD